MRRLVVVFILLLTTWAAAKPPQRTSPGRFEKLWALHTANTKQALEAYHAAQPVVIGSRLVYANALDGVGVIDRASGRKLWKFAVRGGVDTDLLVHQDRLFFGANDGVFYSLNLSTGQKNWSLSLSAPPSGLSHERGVVYMMTRKAVVYALHASTGQVRWSVSLGTADTKTLQMRLQLRPAVQGDFVLVGFGDTLYALKKQSGQISWKKNLKSNDTLYLKGGVRGVLGDLRMGSSVVYASHFEKGVFCVNLKTGTILWQQAEGAVSAVRRQGEHLFYATSAGGLMALERASGKKLWHLKGDSYGVATAPEFVGSKLVVGRAQGPLQLIDAVTGVVQREFFTGQGVWARPGVDKASQNIYVMSSRAHLYALGFSL